MRILFTGDSITDASRTEQVEAMSKSLAARGERVSPLFPDERLNSLLGTGYPLLVASQLGYEEPGRYEILNRGVAGNRIVDLDARIKQDCINLKPDVLSILVGINGVAHDAVLQNGVGAEKFERVYDAMLDEIRTALPDCKIILMEPYLLRGPVTEEHWDYFSSQTALRREIVARLAEKHGCALIRTQQLFDDAFARSGNALDWTQDGVHTSPAGALLIAQEWLRVFHSIIQ